jgi:hypothetical protein
MPWRTHGFGLALEASFPILGCPESAVPAGLPGARLELATRAALRRAMPPDCRPVGRSRMPDGEWRVDVIGHPRAGYLMDELEVGLFHVSSGGRVIRCAASRVPRWRWQRHLVGRALPLATTLRGLEPWHASAVAVNGQAIALVGGSGAGKSTIAAELILRGAQLVADDVLALGGGDGRVVAYPGLGLMSLRRPGVDRLAPSLLRRIGEPIGGNEHSIRLAVARREEQLPLGAVYLLKRGSSPLTVLTRPDPAQLIGATFNAQIRPRSGLVRQLEVCAQIARSVRVCTVGVVVDGDYGAVAEQVLTDAAGGTP